MQMTTPATRQPNVPQLVIDFMTTIVDAVKSPKTMEPLVKIAQDVAAANKLTDEENAKREELKKLVAEAAESQAGMQKMVDEVRTSKSQIAESYADIKKQKDELAAQLVIFTEKQAVHNSAEKKIADREAAVKRAEIDLANRTSVIDTRDKEVSKREDNFKAAHSLIGASAKG